MINPDSPAFPVPPDFVSANGELCTVRDLGLTIRAYIAAKALQGLLANSFYANSPNSTPELAAKAAVINANALIAELNKQP